MSPTDLTFQQQRILRLMVRALDGRDQLSFNFYPNPPRVTFDDDVSADSIPATMGDLRAIEAANLLTITDVCFNDEGNMGHLLHAAIPSSRNNFGIPKSATILQALYALYKSEGARRFVGWEELAKETLFSIDEVKTHSTRLKAADYVHAVMSGLQLKAAGIVAIEDAPNPQSIQPSGLVMHNYHGVGNVQHGDGNTATAYQNFGTDATDAFNAVAAILPQLPAGVRDEAEEELATIKEPGTKRSTAKAIIGSLFQKAPNVAEWISKMLALAKSLGYKPEEFANYVKHTG